MRLFLLSVGIGVLFAGLTSIALASTDYRQSVDITFPTDERAGHPLRHENGQSYGYTDDYDGRRSNSCGLHRATDIFGDTGWNIYAAEGGEIAWMPAAEQSYGWMIAIEGDDGRRYSYVHLGRDGGSRSQAYAPGLSQGDRVERGQHIGYLGYSGNASASAPHLHFEIADPHVGNAPCSYRDGRGYVNPYQSLNSAVQRGDFSNGTRAQQQHDGPFPDVPPEHTHAGAIEWVADTEITTGFPDGTYRPGHSVERGQMASFLVRGVADLSESQNGSGFPDVPDDHTHGPTIGGLAEAEVADGYPDGTYRPGAAVNRGQMAAYIARSLGLEPGDITGFDDVPDGHPQAGWIAAVADAEIASGFGDGSYRPGAPVTRGQMATFLRNALAD
jgi:murein DD-endopeptidase MepM/ murein hydrolase activator NlpD